ncbi:MAG: DNA alkylation repair protein, partial [Gemmatimonadota bacterium]|nr:DNA alkylation repair protein [Gemmatimonadota bacterium]
MTSGVTMSVEEILAWMRARESRRNQAGMARYGIVAANGKVFGITMAALRGLARDVGRDHALAAALWRSGWHEARLLAAFVDEPARVTVAQMDRWTRDFDNWAVCDSTCIHLLSRTPHAWGRVRAWAASPDEFVRRAAFALVAALAVHDRSDSDMKFRSALRLVERHAADPRNFVKKAVSWALRATGNRSRALHADALALATRLA